MKVTINGETKELADAQITVMDLLKLQKVKMPEMVSVELNNEFLDREKFDVTNINEDDEIEFVYYMGGGSDTDTGDWGFDTRMVHCGIDPSLHNGATSVPIYETASFAYDTAQELSDVFSGREFGYTYSRISNPTVAAFENRITALENGAGSIAASSGMAAISTVLFSLTEKDDEIISSKSLFGGTFLLFNKLFKKYGVKVKYVEATDIEAYEKAITDKTRLIFVETIGNPKLDIPDIGRLSAVAQDNNIPLIVDSTLTTPYLFDAKAHGASIVIHSATKYITGNGSAVGGVIVDCGTFDWRNCKAVEINEAAHNIHPQFAFLMVARRNIIQNVGACPSPFNVYLHNLGLETLSLRMDRHCRNALALAEILEEDSRIPEVNYPGLKSSPYYVCGKKQFNGGFGGLLTFRLASREQCFAFIDNLAIVKNLANLGDVRTIIIHPASTIYHECTSEEMAAAGVTDDLLRVSVGIEDIKDITADFKQALEEAMI